MSLKLGNKNISKLIFPNKNGLEGALNDYDIVTKKVAEDNNIQEGDFVSLDDSLLSLPTKTQSYSSAAFVSGCLWGYSYDSPNHYAIIMSHAGTSASSMKFSRFAIDHDKIYQSGVNSSGGYFGSPTLMNFGHWKVCYVCTSTVNSVLRAYVLMIKYDGSSWSYYGFTEIASPVASSSVSAAKLSDTSMIVVYSRTSGTTGLYGVVINLDFDNMSMSKGSETFISSNSSAHLNDTFCRIDDSHMLISIAGVDASCREIRMLSVDNNVISVSDYYYDVDTKRSYKNALRMVSSSVYMSYRSLTTGKWTIDKLNIGSSSITKDSTVYEFDPSINISTIHNFVQGSSTVCLLYYDSFYKSLFLTLFDLNWNVLDWIKLIGATCSTNRSCDIIHVDYDKYAVIYNSATTDEGVSSGFSYAYWDGENFIYKNDLVYSCNNTNLENLYGVAASDTSSEGTVDIYIPKGDNNGT